MKVHYNFDKCFRHPSVAARDPRRVFLAMMALVALLAGASQPVDPRDDASPPGPPEPVVIAEGQVTDSFGGGQKDVEVTVHFRNDDGTRGDVIAITRTDDFGDFSVVVDAPLRAGVVVIFSKPQYAELVTELELDPDGDPPFLAESLLGNLQLAGRVKSSLYDGPVGGATVTLKADYQDRHETTDQEGQFVFKGVSPGRAELIVECKGFGREHRKIECIEKEKEIAVSLQPERVVHFKVVDDQMQPISGVAIELFDQTRADFRTAITDEQGSCTFRGLHFQTRGLALRLTHERFVCSSGFDQRIELPQEPLESTHELQMQTAGRIEGTVMAARTNEPLYGVRLMTGTQFTTDSPRDWSDFQGRFQITGVPPGEVVVTAHMAGCSPELKSVLVQAGKTASLNLLLTSPAVLTGFVKDSQGDPAPGAEVVATSWRGYTTLGLRAMTDNDGRFAMENAPQDKFEVVALARSGSSKPQTVTAGADTPIEITLDDESSDVGGGATLIKVGEPVPDLTVTTLAGKTLKLREQKGSTLVIDFWASWCGPCVAELPRLAELHAKYKDRKDFLLLGISKDFDAADLRQFLAEHKEVVWPQVVGEDGGAFAAAQAFGVTWIPNLVIIGSDGNVAAAGLQTDQVVERVDRLFLP